VHTALEYCVPPIALIEAETQWSLYSLTRLTVVMKCWFI